MQRRALKHFDDGLAGNMASNSAPSKLAKWQLLYLGHTNQKIWRKQKNFLYRNI